MAIYELKITPRIFEDINKSTAFELTSLEGQGSSTKFKIVLGTNIENVSNIENDIGTITDENGQLDYSTFTEIVPAENPDVYLQYTPKVSYGAGFNIIPATNQVDLTIGSETELLRGIFLVNKANNYLFGYGILNNNLGISGLVQFPLTGVLFDVQKIVS